METFTTYITSMNLWDWAIPGIILFAIHFMFKSEILKWTGLGAIIIAVLMLFIEGFGWQGQWITFLVFTAWGLFRNRGASV